MSSHEPKWGPALAAALLLVIVLVAGIVLIQFLVDQPYRPAAIRLIAASVLLVAVFRVRAFVRASTERPPAWDAERAGEARWAPASSAHTQFEHFHDEMKFSVRSQRYFEHVLWPRLCELARVGGEPAAWLDRPPGRRFGRGPSLEALRVLIASLERRR